MKTCTYVGLFVALLFALPTAFAQEAKTDASDEWMIPLEGARIDGRIKDKAKFLQDKKRYADVEYVHMRSVAEAQQDGLLSFKVPGKNRKLRARAVDIRAESTQDYEWNGEFDDFYGFMNVVSVKGQIRAHVSYDGDEYDIYPLEDGVHAVAKLLPPDSTFQGGCGMDAILASPADSSDYQYEHEHDEQGRIGAESSREVGCLQNVVRVLVLHTARARTVGNPQAEAQLQINNFNQAEVNSQAAGTLGRLELAGVAPFELTGGETQFNVEDDLEELIANGQALRRQFNADLVVLFTEGNYQIGNAQILGIAGNFRNVGGVRFLELIDERSFAIVDIQEAGNNLTFVHEVGHMFGMRHQTCAEFFNPLLPACDDRGTFEHGYNFRKRRWPKSDILYHTIMHQTRDGSRQLLHFSNPDVGYSGGATGWPGIADNTRQLEVAAPTVVNYEAGGNLTASIIGPSSVNLYTRYTWEASYSCGNNYTFQWETSEDGFNYYSAGTSETMSRSVYNSSTSQVYLRVRVTANGQTATGFKIVYVNNTRTQDAMASKDTANWQQVIERTESEDGTVVLRDAYPNPLVNQTQLGFTIARPETINLDILTLNGQWVKQVAEGTLEAGYHELTLEREGLSAGVYFYRLLVGDEQYARRLVVE